MHALCLHPEAGCHQILCYQAYTLHRLGTTHRQGIIATDLPGPILCLTRHDQHLAGHLSLVNVPLQLGPNRHRLVSTEMELLPILIIQPRRRISIVDP